MAGTGIRALMGGNIKMCILVAKPAKLEAITLTELTAGIDAASDLARNGTRFSATASETIADPRVSDRGNPSVYGASNAEGAMAVFWEREDGKYTADANPTYEAVRNKGTVVWVVKRSDQDETAPWAADDEYAVYEWLTDTPQDPTETSGWMKMVVPGQVQQRVEGKVAAGA